MEVVVSFATVNGIALADKKSVVVYTHAAQPH